MRSLSKADCDEGRTWGVNDSGIWVKDGCRADFIIGYGGTPGGGTASRVIRCESRGNRWEHCDADTRGGAELVRVAGGDDIFPERAAMPLARDRILADAGEVVRRAPDIILGSWCGKKFRPERVVARPGWQAIPAVRDGELHEIKSPIILQPGPAALSDGLDALHRIIVDWSARHG